MSTIKQWWHIHLFIALVTHTHMRQRDRVAKY